MIIELLPAVNRRTQKLILRIRPSVPTSQPAFGLAKATAQ